MTEHRASSGDARGRRHTIRSSNSWRGYRKVALVALTLCALVGVSLAPALSSGRSLSDKIDGKKRHLNRVRDKESNLTTHISALGSKIRGIRVRIGSLQRQEDHALVVIAKRQQELAVATARYKKEHARFVRLRKELDKAEGILSGRLVELYKADQPDAIGVLLEADGFEDLLARSDYVSKIGSQDRAIMGHVKELKAQSAHKRALLVDLKNRAQVALDAIQAQKRQLAATRSDLSVQRGKLDSTRAEQQKALGGVQSDRKQLEGDLSKLSAQVEQQLGSGSVPAGPIKRGSGQFIWPVNGPITSPFCERRAWEACHPGIDIGVGSGTPIRAAGSGVVALAGPNGGYGNYTCINHGGSLSTCYAHQSVIKVSVGQHVSQGQVIGLSGCTGLCFGPHLHFEVRVNGAVQNPVNYL